MASLTTKFGFRKPDGADPVNVTTDINDNLDKIDKLYGAKDRQVITDGSMTVSNASTTALAPAPRATIFGSVKAIPGDWVEVIVSGLWDAQNTDGYMDAWSCPSGDSNHPVNSWSGNTDFASGSHQGVLAWRGEPLRHSGIAGGILRQIVADDIDGSNNLKVHLRARSASGTRNIWAIPGIPFIFCVVNKGSNIG